jgi:Arc/MetJ-type ribon-helix-helix transcriptional regulator
MKVSVSLPDDDLAFIDEYVHRTGAPSRSSALHEAVTLLRLSEIEDAYANAWEEWREAGDDDLWEATSGDGLAGTGPASDGPADAPR